MHLDITKSPTCCVSCVVRGDIQIGCCSPSYCHQVQDLHQLPSPVPPQSMSMQAFVMLRWFIISRLLGGIIALTMLRKLRLVKVSRAHFWVQGCPSAEPAAFLEICNSHIGRASASKCQQQPWSSHPSAQTSMARKELHEEHDRI